MARLDAPGARVRALWNRLSPLPGGSTLFSLALGRMVPYTGRLGARVVALEPGFCRAELRDRRAVRNHLGSIHAMALANVGEMATGLAVLGAMPATVRGILVGFEIDFVKKARGSLTAECRCTVPSVDARLEHAVEAQIRDAGGDEVARVRARWLLSPVDDGSRP
ncbi:MAG: hotdog fold domain-containing protein [Longimicrobiales bacterium]